MIKTVTTLLLFASVTFFQGCVSAGGASGGGSASIQVRSGYFFGHDFRNTNDVVFVLDLSGSMSESSGSIVEQAGTNVGARVAGGLTGAFLGRGAGRAVRRRVMSLQKKIEKVKLHLIASVSGLPQGARFNIVLFSDRAQLLSPVMIPAGGASTAALVAFVDQLEEGGSTDMYSAMETALYQPATNFVLLTDGLPTSSSPGAILDLAHRHNRDGRLHINTVGVGSDQAREFLSTLAGENGGFFAMYN